MSVSTAYEKYLQWEIHRFGRVMMVMDTFFTADCVNLALSETLIGSSIRNEFEQTGFCGYRMLALLLWSL